MISKNEFKRGKLIISSILKMRNSDNMELQVEYTSIFLLLIKKKDISSKGKHKIKQNSCDNKREEKLPTQEDIEEK